MNVRGYGVGAYLFISVVSLLGVPAAGEAQQLRQVGLDVDNDFFLTFNPRRGTDYEYTHGTRLWAEWSGAIEPLAGISATLLGCDTNLAECNSRIEFGQEVYTPRREVSYGPIPGERPHAGWLYLLLGATAEREHTLTVYHLQVGVVGPPALAEEFQLVVHELLDFREPRGWDHQLPFEPGLQLHVGRSRPLLSSGRDGLTFTGGYGWAVDAGNVLTRGRAHVRAQLCYGGVNCRAGSNAENTRAHGMVLHGGVGPALVVRNVFLDGTLLRDSYGVEKNVLVVRARAGIGIYFGRFSLDYEITARGPEYRTEPDGFSYGTIRLRYRP